MEPTQAPLTSSLPPSPGMLERLMNWIYDIRLWFTTAARVGQLMARGAYLIGERRRLFVKLGEMVYEKTLRPVAKDENGDKVSASESVDKRDGTTPGEDLLHLAHQIDRLTKKLEIEEMLIRSARFGGRATRQLPEPSGVGENETR